MKDHAFERRRPKNSMESASHQFRPHRTGGVFFHILTDCGEGFAPWKRQMWTSNVVRSTLHGIFKKCPFEFSRWCEALSLVHRFWKKSSFWLLLGSMSASRPPPSDSLECFKFHRMDFIFESTPVNIWNMLRRGVVRAFRSVWLPLRRKETKLEALLTTVRRWGCEALSNLWIHAIGEHVQTRTYRNNNCDTSGGATKMMQAKTHSWKQNMITEMIATKRETRPANTRRDISQKLEHEARQKANKN